MSGLVYLLDAFGDPLCVNKYQKPSERRAIINKWRLLYASAFNGCMIQIAPVVDDAPRRNRQKIIFRGSEMSVYELSKKTRIAYRTLLNRIRKGMPPDEAVGIRVDERRRRNNHRSKNAA